MAAPVFNKDKEKHPKTWYSLLDVMRDDDCLGDLADKPVDHVSLHCCHTITHNYHIAGNFRLEELLLILFNTSSDKIKIAENFRLVEKF